jgi:cell wall-associated NlpC family hydrolase
MRNRLIKIILLLVLVLVSFGANEVSAAEKWYYVQQSIFVEGAYDLGSGNTEAVCKKIRNDGLLSTYNGIKNQSPLPAWWTTKKISNCKVFSTEPPYPYITAGFFKTTDLNKTLKQAYDEAYPPKPPPPTPPSTGKSWYYAYFIAEDQPKGESSVYIIFGENTEPTCKQNRFDKLQQEKLKTTTGSFSAWDDINRITDCISFDSNKQVSYPDFPNERFIKTLKAAYEEYAGSGGYWWFQYKSEQGLLLTDPRAFITEADCEKHIKDYNYTSSVVPKNGKNCFQSNEKPGDDVTTTPGTSTTSTTSGLSIYKLLAPLPIIGDEVKITGGTALQTYLGGIFRLLIGLAGIFAVLMIVIGGIQYMTSEVVFSKEEAKQRIWNAVWGLLLAIGSFVILNTINPDLVGGGLTISKATIEFEGDTDVPINIQNISPNLASLGISCPKTGGRSALPGIANSFQGKVTYIFGAKGDKKVQNTVAFDCSGFVNAALACAGVKSGFGGTSGIFGAANEIVSFSTDGTKVKLKGQTNEYTLQSGDLLGWKAGDGGQKNGHVYMYIGGGKVIDSHGPGYDKKPEVLGKAISVRNLVDTKKPVKYLRIPE